MNTIIKSEDVLLRHLNMYNISPRDKPNWVVDAMKEYAKEKCAEQRKLCLEYDNDLVPEPTFD